MDIQNSDLLELWESLKDGDKESSMAFMRVLAERNNPEHQEQRIVKNQEYHLQFEKAQMFRNEIAAAVKSAGNYLCERLGNKTDKQIFFDYEVLLMLGMLAEYRPLSLFDEGSKLWGVGIAAIKRLDGKLNLAAEWPVLFSRTVRKPQ